MDTLKPNKARLVISFLLIVIVLVGAVTAVAEFTKSSRSRRVVATYGDEGVKFSSNYLVLNADIENNVFKKTLYTNSEGTATSGNIMICNFSQNNRTQPYEYDIAYTLVAKLVKLSESAGVYSKSDATAGDVGSHTVKVKLNDGTEVTLSSGNLSHSFEGNLLDRRQPTTDICHVEFDSDFLNASNLYLYLCAQPIGGSAGLYPLDAVLNVAKKITERRNLWIGEFNEKTNTGVPQQPDYDGFNYIISGTGKGTCTLTWNNEKLQISQVFLAQNGLTFTTLGTSSSITFTVDSDTINRYDLQFYYAEEATPFVSWDELTGGESGEGYVQLSYTESSGS